MNSFPRWCRNQSWFRHKVRTGTTPVPPQVKNSGDYCITPGLAWFQVKLICPRPCFVWPGWCTSRVVWRSDQSWIPRSNWSQSPKERPGRDQRRSQEVRMFSWKVSTYYGVSNGCESMMWKWKDLTTSRLHLACYYALLDWACCLIELGILKPLSAGAGASWLVKL